MKKITAYFYSYLYCVLVMMIVAQHAVASNNVSNNLSVIALDGSASSALMRGLAKSAKNDVQSMIFEDDEPIDISLTITPATDDVGLKRQLYIVAKYNEQWFYKNASGQWLSLAGDLSNLKGHKETVLSSSETVNVISNELLGAGEYLIYVGYVNHESKLIYNQQALSIVVFSSKKANLHRVKSEQTLKSYFKMAFKNVAQTYASVSSGPFSGGDSVSATSSTTEISGTNIQEAGVDEADTIKTNGQQLFALSQCQSTSNSTCLSAYQISETPAANKLLSQYQFESNNDTGSMYLANVKTDTGDKEMAVRVTSSKSFYWWWWVYPGNWTNNETEVNMIDVTEPDNMTSKQKIKIDGNLISSRRIGNMLYLVTRMTPEIEGYKDWYPVLPAGSITQSQIDDNQKLLDDMKLEDIIPTIQFDNDKAIALHQAQDCYIPAHSSNKRADRSLISVTAIPLDKPENFQAHCIVGTTETFYASTQSLYLASSRYQYDYVALDYSIADSTEQYKTEIHKFSINEQGLTYKGSGDVPGHLGWSMDKKPFRMGEYNDELRIATSLGSTWNDSSTTSLTILKETEEQSKLSKIGEITGLGKPGESLFAARFIGKRGYLVTFKQTDPLYVLDLEDGTDPKILAALEITGFSDYLHPIGDTHLLGIGKHAVPMLDSQGKETENTVTQGVKISLFDVSTASNVSEVQSMIIGKRGTHSAALDDHHAFAFLDAHNGSPVRFSLPIDLYDTVPQNSSWFDADNPSAYYDWTHTGLYVFNLQTDEPQFDLAGKLITAESIPSYHYQGPRSGRSVIQGDSVHYFYDNKLYSRAINDLD